MDLLDDLDAAALAQASASIAAAVGAAGAAAPQDLAEAAQTVQLALASGEGVLESQRWSKSTMDARPFAHEKSSPTRPPQPDPLSVSAPTGDASPATSAAPLTALHEHSAAVGSAVVDAWDRRPFFNRGDGGKETGPTTENEKDESKAKAKTATAMGGAAAAAALGGPYAASTLLYSLWRDPSVAALALQTWGLVDGLVFPAGTGRP